MRLRERGSFYQMSTVWSCLTHRPRGSFGDVRHATLAGRGEGGEEEDFYIKVLGVLFFRNFERKTVMKTETTTDRSRKRSSEVPLAREFHFLRSHETASWRAGRASQTKRLRLEPHHKP